MDDSLQKRNLFVVDGVLLLVLNGHRSVGLEVDINWRIDSDLMVVVVALQRLEVGVLWESSALVVVESGDTIWLLDLVLSLDDQVAVLDGNVQLGRVNGLWHVEFHLNVLAASWDIDDSWEEIIVGVLVDLLEWDLNDELALWGHERHELVGLGVSRERVGLLELLDVEVSVVLLDFLAASHGELVADHVGLDRLWRVAGAVQRDAVLLWHSWHSRGEELWLGEPLEVAADHVVELIERVEEIDGRWTGRVLEWSQPRVHVER